MIITNQNKYPMQEVTREVLVFKTDIDEKSAIENLRDLLHKEQRITKWNVDVEDIDNVLRIESHHLTPAEVIQLVNQLGYSCEELPE
jgi:hypothetical protein